ncbi:MAG: N-acetylneuraminate synthase [Dehalococcoidia bacterium]|nr:N-acetylneuraminate synthase [Dehalococcoidia bacterium]
MPTDKIKISHHAIGNGQPCFIIAEAGVNHNGDIRLAKKLIDVAKEAGADAVKFQTFTAEEIVSPDAPKAEYQKVTTGAGESQYEMIKKLELSRDDFKKLYSYARTKGIMFLSTPFDRGSADFLDKLGVAAFKIPSGEITNFLLLKHIALKGKSIILSTGMATLGEIETALNVLSGAGAKDIILLHCITSYPAKPEDMNLRAMQTLRHAFGYPVGLSDHTLGLTIPVAAAALDAGLIEKHFTLDRELPGPDHRASLEPRELKAMVNAIRDVEKALGNGIKKLTKEEEVNKLVVRRSLVARVAIPKGAAITEDMLDAMRPATGIEPSELKLVVGKVARTAIKRNQFIMIDDLQG